MKNIWYIYMYVPCRVWLKLTQQWFYITLNAVMFTTHHHICDSVKRSLVSISVDLVIVWTHVEYARLLHVHMYMYVWLKSKYS